MKRLWPILVASGLSLALLLYLGFWQIQRLQWKQEMIAKVDKAIGAEPLDYSTLKSPVADSTKIKVTGTFSAIEPYRMIASLNGGPGWRLVQPFVSDKKVQLLVDRGIINDKQEIVASEKVFELVGILRYHQSTQGLFDPNNDISGNRWYWWDIYAMQHNLQEMPMEDAVLHLLPNSPGTEGLYVDTPKANLRNNHLGYAITWFGLAAVLVVMTAIFLFQSRHSKRARNAVE